MKMKKGDEEEIKSNKKLKNLGNKKKKKKIKFFMLNRFLFLGEFFLVFGYIFFKNYYIKSRKSLAKMMKNKNNKTIF
jgi:hypothetical protein